MSYVEILRHCQEGEKLPKEGCLYTFMPSSEKQGGTAELSSSASERRIGNFSTADIGISPL